MRETRWDGIDRLVMALLLGVVAVVWLLGSRMAVPDRCPAVPLVMDLDGATPAALDDVAAAVEELQELTGVRFEPAEPGPLERGSIVLTTTWDTTPPASGQELTELGRAEPTVGTRVGGVVRVNQPAGLVTGADTRVSWRGVVLHELGHLFGLPHSADPADLMHPVLTDAPARWSPAEEDALTAIGVGLGCLNGRR